MLRVNRITHASLSLARIPWTTSYPSSQSSTDLGHKRQVVLQVGRKKQEHGFARAGHRAIVWVFAVARNAGVDDDINAGIPRGDLAQNSKRFYPSTHCRKRYARAGSSIGIHDALLFVETRSDDRNRLHRCVPKTR